MKKKMIFLFTILFFFTFTMYSLAMATIFVEATDNDGWARTHFKLYKYSQGERKYLAYGGGTSWQDKGKYKFIVEPGIYKILTAYGETHKEIKNIQIANKNYTWVSFDFSSKEYNHLEIYIRELTEQGDGDNLFELGEKISLKIEIGSGNVEKINIILNDKLIEKYSTYGNYDITIPCEKLGENVLKIEIKNKNTEYPSVMPLSFIVDPQDGKSGKIEHVEKSRSEEKEDEKEKVILPEHDTLIYHAEKEATATKIKMYVKSTPDNKALFKIILTADVPSPLAQNNFMGNGWISLILLESTYVDYSSIKIYGTSNIGSNDYVEYQPMAKTLMEKLDLFKYVISKIPIVGLISDVSKIRPSIESSSSQTTIDLNNYDVVNVDWQVPLFNYWRQIKIEIPIKITHQIEVGLYAYWQSIAVSSDGSGPTFVRDNIVEPGLDIQISYN